MDDLVRVTQWRRSLAVILAGILVSLISWWAASSADRAVIERDLQSRARVDAELLSARFTDLEHPVMAAADFVAADHDVISPDFERFASFVAPRAPSMLWLAWAALVPDAERDAFEAAIPGVRPNLRITERAPGGALAPAQRRAGYIPLFAVKRFDHGASLVGLDLAGNAAQRSAAERARDEGRPIATGPLLGVGTGRPDQIIVVIAPIYRHNERAPDDVASRRRTLVGYIVGAYAMDAVLSYITAGVAQSDEVIGFARPLPTASFGQAVAAEPPATTGPSTTEPPATASPSNLAAPGPSGTEPPATTSASNEGAARPSSTEQPPPPPGGYRVMQRLGFSGQAWTATFYFPPPAIASRGSYAPLGWLGSGLLMTALLGTVVARGETRRLATERLVVTRTRELSDANERLHQSAEMLEATLDAAPLGIIALDGQARICLWNRGAERIFGHEESEVLGRSYIDLVVPAEHRSAAVELHARIAAGEPRRDVEVERRRRDGAMLDIRVAGNPLRDASGALHGIVFANQDITESRKLEAELRQAQKMEAIGQLTGGVAHDFNNLLGTAITSLDLLREMLAGRTEEDELAAQALDAMLHGADLVRRLLTFARRQPLQPECVLLNDLVLDAVRLLRPLLGDSVEVRLDLGEELWPVLVDRAQFETTLINLATNARDAMPSGGMLTIATRNARVADATDPNFNVPAGDYAAVFVRDTGTGMPADLLQRIFEPFFTTKGKTVGTGLGLSMVLGFIKQSGGHISVDSEEGHGSCFHLYLCRTEADGVGLDPWAAGHPPARRHAGCDVNVLVVEDNPGLRGIVVRQLTRRGYRVIEAEDAGAALAVLERGDPVDLLFTDVVMPGGMSGLDLVRVARGRWPGLRVLLTSGYPEALVDGAAALTGIRLLDKPYREDALAHAIRDALAE